MESQPFVRFAAPAPVIAQALSDRDLTIAWSRLPSGRS